jgi:hypothetical protein
MDHHRPHIQPVNLLFQPSDSPQKRTFFAAEEQIGMAFGQLVA